MNNINSKFILTCPKLRYKTKSMSAPASPLSPSAIAAPQTSNLARTKLPQKKLTRFIAVLTCVMSSAVPSIGRLKTSAQPMKTSPLLYVRHINAITFLKCSVLLSAATSMTSLTA